MADVRNTNEVQGPYANDAAMGTVNPVLEGGRAFDGLPAAVSADSDAVWRLIDRYGRAGVSLDPDTGQPLRVSGFGALEIGDRNLVMADYLGDSVEATRWTTTNANGGTTTSSVGEGLSATSANANGSSVIQTIEKVRWRPGVTYSFGCDLRIGAGLALNTRRWGLFTGTTTPTDGYYFEATGAGPTFNIGFTKASTPTVVASGSFTRNATAPFTIDTNYHRYEIIISGNLVLYVIDGIVRHVLTQTGITTPRVTTPILPMTISNVNAASAATSVTLGVTGIWVSKIGDDQDTELADVDQNKVAQYTTTQTSTTLWTPATGKAIAVDSIQIQAGGTVAGTVQVYFGTGAYSRGTSRTIFDGEFAPSATLKPGVVMLAPARGWKGNVDDLLRVTDSAAINPLTVNVWGREI